MYHYLKIKFEWTNCMDIRLTYQVLVSQDDTLKGQGSTETRTKAQYPEK